MWTWKKIVVPKSNETREVNSVELWVVKWRSRQGELYTSFEFEAFPSEYEANQFAESLRKAFELLRHTWGTNITVYKQKDK